MNIDKCLQTLCLLCIFIGTQLYAQTADLAKPVQRNTSNQGV